MDINEFFDLYLSEDILEIADVIIDFLKQELDDELLEEYAFGELVTEFTGHHEEAKKFDKIEAFREVLKNNQASLYQELGEYVNDTLIKYYCFRNEEQKVAAIVADIGSINYGHINLLNTFKQCAYYQYTDLANAIITQKYTDLRKVPKNNNGVDFDLAIVKYYIELEQLFLAYKNNSDYDLNDFKRKVSAYNFELDEEYYKYVEMGLVDDSLEGTQKLLKTFPSNKLHIMAAFETKFLKVMQPKNCSLPVAGMIWYNVSKYLEQKQSRNWSEFFTLEAISFKQYLNNLSSFWLDKTNDIALTVWGCGHMLDFIYQAQIISEGQYKQQKDLLRQLKEEFKKRKKYVLWESSFVHQWLPDEGISSEQWEAEKEEFERSYDMDYKEFEEERLKTLMGPTFTVPKTAVATPKQLPSAKKIGRNEKVTVRYHDGKVVKNVKYKKVMKDVESGKCEIV